LIVTLRVTMVFYHAKCVKGYGTEMSTLPLTQLGLLMRYEPFLDGWGRLITIFCKTDKGLNREEKAFVERRNFITEKYLRVIHPGAQEEYRNWRIGSKDILLANAGDWRKALPPRETGKKYGFYDVPESHCLYNPNNYPYDLFRPATIIERPVSILPYGDFYGIK